MKINCFCLLFIVSFKIFNIRESSSERPKIVWLRFSRYVRKSASWGVVDIEENEIELLVNRTFVVLFKLGLLFILLYFRLITSSFGELSEGLFILGLYELYLCVRIKGNGSDTFGIKSFSLYIGVYISKVHLLLLIPIYIHLYHFCIIFIVTLSI